MIEFINALDTIYQQKKLKHRTKILKKNSYAKYKAWDG